MCASPELGLEGTEGARGLEYWVLETRGQTFTISLFPGVRIVP